MSDVTRTVKTTMRSMDPDGKFSDGETDNGFEFVLLEKQWADNQEDLSCVPFPAKYLMLWQWSEKHGKYLYHAQDVPGRTVIEWHGANVQDQILGCGALGARIEEFESGSLGENMPPVNRRGVVASEATLDAFHAAMKNAGTGEQDPFWWIDG